MSAKFDRLVMADICTLVLVTTMNAIGCVPQQVCDPEVDGKIFCGPSLQAGSCLSPPPPTYTCKRPDGTLYTYEDKR
jgi:hypothetical protein